MLAVFYKKIPIKCASVGRKNRDGTVGKPWTEIYLFLALFIHTWHRYMWGGSKRTAIKTSTIIKCLYICWIVKAYKCFGGIHINCYQNIVDRLSNSDKHHLTADECWLKIDTSLQVHTILRRVKHFIYLLKNRFRHEAASAIIISSLFLFLLSAVGIFFNFHNGIKFDSSLEFSPFDQAILRIVWRNEKGHICNTWYHVFFFIKRGMAPHHSIFL